MTPRNKAEVTSEFARTASSYGRRTASRYDALDPVGRSGLQPGAKVLEVGGGTGSFLSSFTGMAVIAVDLDLTMEMLEEGRRRDDRLVPVQGDGTFLPFRSRVFDLVASVQMLHHVPEPLPLLKEMRRVLHEDGRVMLIDQVAEESYEKASVMSAIEKMRDPSHAVSRPVSAYRSLLLAAGFEIESQDVVEVDDTLADWMSPEEFPTDRIEATLQMIESMGHLSGMNFRREGDGWAYTRRRLIMTGRRP